MAHKLTSKRLQKTLLSLLAALLIYLFTPASPIKQTAKLAQQYQPGLYPVVYVYDGDTIEVNMNGGKEKVRLIGVDTPETHDPRKAVQCFGVAASNYTKSLLKDKSVRLEADPQDTNRDRYNRLLRYAYLPDGQFINAMLIQNGYGFAYIGFPFSKQAEFEQYQIEARINNKGLWGGCKPVKNSYGGYTSNNAN